MARFEIDVVRDKTNGRFININEVITALESENEKLKEDNARLVEENRLLHNRTKMVDVLKEMLNDELKMEDD